MSQVIPGISRFSVQGPGFGGPGTGSPFNPFGPPFLPFGDSSGNGGGVAEGDPGGICARISDVTLRTACEIAAGIFGGGNGKGDSVTADSGVPGGSCGIGFHRDILTGACVPNAVGGAGTPTPAETAGATRLHPAGFHGDSIPSQREIRRRICPRGNVLGKDGWCHSRIANRDRAYPKPRKALGTPGELNALATSKKFARRLVAAEKGIKATARDLAKAGGIKLGGR